MKYVKIFEVKSKEDKEERDELFQNLIDENPLSKDHDFYAFIGKEDFKENKDGSYRKTLYIENMVRMTKDTYAYDGMMHIRARFQSDSKVYYIWLPDFLREEVEGKGSGSLPDYIIELIDKYKINGPTEEGRKIYQEVVNRRKRAKDSGLL